MTRTALVRDQQDAILHYYNSLDNIEHSLDFPYNDTDWLNHPLNQGLVGYWPLRRQFQTPSGLLAKDYSGNGNDGTINNGPVLVDDATMGRVTSFDGIDDNIQSANSGVCDFTTNDFSVCGFFYRTVSGAQHILVAKITATTGYRILIGATNLIEADLRTSSSTTGIQISPTTVGTNKWYFYGFSAARASNGNFYLWDLSTNTLVTATADISARSGSLSTAVSLFVGRNSAAADSFWPGRQAELRFYNRTRTQTEFEQIMRLGLKRL